MLLILLSQHGHNILCGDLKGTLKTRVSVTNLVEFERRLIHEVSRLGDFSIFDIINRISNSFPPGLSLEDARVGCDNVLHPFLWLNNSYTGVSKGKKLFQRGINIR